MCSPQSRHQANQGHSRSTQCRGIAPSATKEKRPYLGRFFAAVSDTRAIDTAAREWGNAEGRRSRIVLATGAGSIRVHDRYRER